ncbi:hypothetical protein QA601_11915 [Chitinispirillales bacterium ANBcel5]|uniref:hypothetical protein n=1 Tax=Cellulosispirillum alkaliphilum TaxID=3039283 RepID=UPI002A595D70|nr:hypothetical protein [Chitinispirillales bacterium ANBcel5]
MLITGIEGLNNMVTDRSYNYPSPSGTEMILAAGRFAGINPGSTVLDFGSAFGEGPCVLASHFRCKVMAFETAYDKLSSAITLSVNRTVSHLIDYHNEDLLKSPPEENLFDLAIIEGGSLKSRIAEPLFIKMWDLLQDRGWFSFSAPVLLQQSLPPKLLSVYEAEGLLVANEEELRDLAHRCGFDVQFTALIPRSGWDNYFAHLAMHLEDSSGYYADSQKKMASHNQIDLFYRLDAFRYIGYLFCITRKRD